NSGNSHLLSTIINVTTGMTPLAFADQYLFGPLGITRRAWTTDPQGIQFGGSNLALTARDMAKFGLLYLNNGTWDEQQVVSSDWVNSSNQGPATPWTLTSYGYQWWIDDQDDWYSARGYNGQFIYVIAEHDMVVVFSSDHVDGTFTYDGLVGQIVDAITNIYPNPDDPQPIDPIVILGVVSLGVVAIVIIVVRTKT
ncbi:MAG: serine hydrolase domain-containing protein, partial [Candidatus Thorarchaeota archaeon]